jgi:aspartate carbamoyltransferase catalytic subunit
MKPFEGRDILSMKDFNREEADHIFEVADWMEPIARSRHNIDLLRHKALATLFFQPSTRTRMSFEGAMRRLGGSVTTAADAKVMRAGDTYAESWKDTAMVVQHYVDAAVIRHFQAGVPAEFARHASIPVLNGGDGYGGRSEHPTQALLDTYSIYKLLGGVDGIKILIWGDLKYRCMHSLAYALALFKDVKAYGLAPEDMRYPAEVMEDIRLIGLDYSDIDDPMDVIPEVDVIYITGPAHNWEDKMDDKYILDLKKVKRAKKEMVILHPLPRVHELPVEVDDTPHAQYSEQALYGLIVRMALLALVLGARP